VSGAQGAPCRGLVDVVLELAAGSFATPWRTVPNQPWIKASSGGSRKDWSTGTGETSRIALAASRDEPALGTGSTSSVRGIRAKAPDALVPDGWDTCLPPRAEPRGARALVHGRLVD
jgi:hypothetical protein